LHYYNEVCNTLIIAIVGLTLKLRGQERVQQEI